jgi:predicted ribosome quality control (RQC) complex YloA/Tae2 family protein
VVGLSEGRRGGRTARLFTYELPGGWQVLAGRTDADNDTLSMRIAGPRDWWFHVHGLPGSHVVLQVPEGAEPEREVLKAAAGIAAYHSKAREAGVVPVTCTRACNVSKPRGARPGSVQIRKEFTLKVRPGLGQAVRTDGEGGEE